MILCHCHFVTDRTVATAVRGGARTLAGVCQSTGAGRDCGACVFSVKQTINQVEATALVPAAAEAEVA